MQIQDNAKRAMAIVSRRFDLGTYGQFSTWLNGGGGGGTVTPKSH